MQNLDSTHQFWIDILVDKALLDLTCHAGMLATSHPTRLCLSSSPPSPPPAMAESLRYRSNGSRRVMRKQRLG